MGSLQIFANIDETYYKDQLNKVVTTNEFAPSIKIVSNTGLVSQETKYLSLNEKSAKVLIEWLNNHFINK